MTLHVLEVPVGRKSSTPAIVKRMVRFGRRLREHGIHDGQFPSIVDDDHRHQRIRVGKRIVNVFDDGTMQPALLDVDKIYDAHAITAHRNRWHAFWLTQAGVSRRMGWTKAARADLNIAIEERRLMNHD